MPYFPNDNGAFPKVITLLLGRLTKLGKLVVPVAARDRLEELHNMCSFSYSISGKVLRDLEQWNCNLASQSKKSHKQIHRDSSVRSARCIFYEGCTCCLPPHSPRIKLTKRTMQVQRKGGTSSSWHHSDLIININLCAIIYFQRKSPFSKHWKHHQLFHSCKGRFNKPQ